MKPVGEQDLLVASLASEIVSWRFASNWNYKYRNMTDYDNEITVHFFHFFYVSTWNELKTQTINEIQHLAPFVFGKSSKSFSNSIHVDVSFSEADGESMFLG